MSIRNYREYRALMAKINIKKEEYAANELAKYNEKDAMIRIVYDRIKKTKILIVVASIIMAIFLGLFYNFFEIIGEKWMIVIYLSFMLAVYIAFFTALILYKIKFKRLTSEKALEESEQQVIRDEIKKMNQKALTLMISLVCLNEHFYELALINDPDLRKKRWSELILLRLAVISKDIGSILSDEAYISYFKEWESIRSEAEE